MTTQISPEMVDRLLEEVATDEQTLVMLRSVRGYAAMPWTEGHRAGILFALKVLQGDSSVMQ